MKSGTLATRLILAVLCLAIVIYFGVNVAAYFMDPYTTTMAYSYVSENAVTVSGYVVREEEVLSGGGERVYSPRGEGERVSAGGTVALVYQSGQALEDANTLRSLENQLDQLLYARTLAAGAQSTARLDDEINASLLEFRAAMAGGDLTAAGESGDTLRSAVLRHSYAYSGTEELEAAIASLQSQVSSLSASASSGATRITAPKSGLFSSLTDGYETVLHPDMIESLSPTTYRAITPQPVSGSVGKMVYGKDWYFLTLMRAEDVRRLEIGDTITLRFQSGLDRDVTMTVNYMSPEDGGQRVVSFTTDRYLNLTTLLRRQNAQVIFNSYSGIRVPRSAVRLDPRPVTDEEGNPVLDAGGQEKTENVTCVYCLWGTTARLKPVTILWQEEEYILVTPDEAYLSTITSADTQESRRLRPGDEVITAAEDIYDGKVIQ